MLGLLTFLLACGDTTESSTSTAEVKLQQVEVKQVDNTKPENTAPAALDVVKEAEKIEREALAPSPMESRKAAEKEGLTTQLSSLIQKRDFAADTKDVDQIALQTGVLLADTVLKIKEMEKAELLGNLKNIESNLKVMGAGEGLVFTITELHTKVTNDALTRDSLLLEMDEIVGYSRPTEGFGKNDTTGPLLQAGSWLASVNLLAHAMVQESKTDKANTLFRHDKVAEYFLSYVTIEGKEKVPAGIMNTLKLTLESMIIISKKESITKDDVEKIARETSVLLGLL